MDDKLGNTITFMWHAGSNGVSWGVRASSLVLGDGFLEEVPCQLELRVHPWWLAPTSYTRAHACLHSPWS